MSLPDTSLAERTAVVTAAIAAKPGAAGSPMANGVTLYKVMGKMFAILEVNKLTGVILKCDPHLAEAMREQYAGIGRRSHLDPRFWIHVDFEGDAPTEQVLRLVDHSYDQVRAGLTKKQQAELAVLSQPLEP
ncbi:MmcQ/YjbR family DNA-binding protein [Phenylobacterium sp.]|jgi:predicted DNA-binding protein (MmcQ/YjbR family)|uniref:MmcQ/YjbR family DNA-binding protein n=1 Tax=Phenylobacterium sp. TaxID=1871053 RepID=UPI002F4144C4